MSAEVRASNSMVRRLHAEVEGYFSTHNGRQTNYEDVFYLAKQALDEVLGEMENPAIRPFVTKLRDSTSQLVETTTETNEILHESYQSEAPDHFQILLNETCN